MNYIKYELYEKLYEKLILWIFWMGGLLFIPILARPHTRWHNADLRWREYLATANIIIPVLQMEWNEFPSLSGNIDQASSKRALNKMSF